MAGGVDKLVLLTRCIRRKFRKLARRAGRWEKGFRHAIDLRETRYQLPVKLHCDGFHDGMHKIELIGVARLGLRRTIEILKQITYDASKTRICRIDFCTDLLRVSVWDLADHIYVSRVQNFTIFNNRGGASFYLQNSKEKSILLYDKIKQYAKIGDPMVNLFGPDDQLTRIEVQLRGKGVPFKEVGDLHRYLEIDFLEQLRFLNLRTLREDTKPLHRLAGARLRDLLTKVGLHATKKQFPASQWAYIEKTLFETLDGKEITDLQARLRRSLDDWLENRIRFPRCHDLPEEEPS